MEEGIAQHRAAPTCTLGPLTAPHRTSSYEGPIIPQTHIQEDHSLRARVELRQAIHTHHTDFSAMSEAPDELYE